MVSLGFSDFSRRYSAESNHPHFDGSQEELLAIIQANWGQREQSPHNQFAVTVPIPQELVHRFYTTSVPLEMGIPLNIEYLPRWEGEEPVLKVSTPGEKIPAKSAEVVLYQPGGLSDEPLEPRQDYYVVAIKAYPTEEKEPMDPITMARNFLECAGGTKAVYSGEDFAKAIWYWWTKYTSIGGV